LTITPHFKSPFNFNNATGIVDVVDQDTLAEYMACVSNVVECFQGDWQDNPSFGIPNPLFADAPLDLTAMQSAITLWEPRPVVTVSAVPNPNDPSQQTINIEVST
jgi:hypothetical protein